MNTFIKRTENQKIKSWTLMPFDSFSLLFITRGCLSVPLIGTVGLPRFNLCVRIETDRKRDFMNFRNFPTKTGSKNLWKSDKPIWVCKTIAHCCCFTF